MAQIRELLDQSQEAKTREQLEFLLTAARAKLGVFENEINDIYRYPEKQEKIQIIGSRAVQIYKEYRANISSGADQQIGEVIDQFFGGNVEDVKSGFATLIKKGLSTVLGNETAGEVEQHFFAVVPNGLVITRMDVKVWRYNYSSEGIISNLKNAFCFYTSLATVDYSKLSMEELVFFVQQMVGADVDKVKAYIDKLKTLYDFGKNTTPEEQHLLHQEQYLKLNNSIG